MGVFDFITDAFTLSVAHAEAASAEPSGDAGVTADEESAGDAEAEKEESSEDAKGGDEEAPEEEEEEEEEEPEDLKPKFEEECANSGTCAPAKHHYDHCVDRVIKQIDEDGKAKENCVEEFFHLAHCASSCAAPKLFQSLK